MKRNGFKAFQRIQQQKYAYCVSQFTPQEQAIREHIKRGFQDPSAYVPGLLNQENRIDHV